MGATIIDALLVTFGLDSSGVKKGSEEVERHVDKAKDKVVKAGKEISDSGKETAEFFNKLKIEVMSLIAVFTGGMALKQFSENTVTTAANVGLLASNLSMSTKEVLSWQMANEKAGGTQAGMLAQLKESAEEMEKVKRGEQSSAMSWIAHYGGNVNGIKTGNDLLMERSRVIKRIWDSGDHTRAASVAKQMGISEDTFNLIKQGPIAIMALVHAQEKNAAISEKNAAEALRLNQQWLELKNTLTSTGQETLLSFLPDMQRSLDSMVKWIDEHRDDIKEWVSEAVKKIKEFVEWSDNAAQSVGGWQVVLGALVALKVGGGLISLAANLALITQSLLAIGGGVGSAALKTLGLLNPATAALGAAWWILKPKELGEGGDKDKEKYGYDKNWQDKYRPPGHKKSPDELFRALEEQYGLPAGLLDSMWLQESSRGKNMLSSKGAQGHFQFMPDTAKQYGLKDPNDLPESAETAARMMRDLLKANGGDLDRSLAAYNWGQGKLDRKGIGQAPAETRNFMREVEGRLPNNGATANNEVNINGPITIMTQATDGKETATSFQEHMKAASWITAQANTAY